MLVRIGSDPARDEASFRQVPLDDDTQAQAIIWSMFATYNKFPAKSSADIALIDNLYFSHGTNLSGLPGPESIYGGYTIINERGDIDTGDFFGWLNVSQAPYLWSYYLNDWIYMEELAADAPGAWGYFYK